MKISYIMYAWSAKIIQKIQVQRYYFMTYKVHGFNVYKSSACRMVHCVIRIAVSSYVLCVGNAQMICSMFSNYLIDSTRIHVHNSPKSSENFAPA